MAAVGDSITQAASTGGSLGADAPQNSWSTGTNSTVNSHAMRLGVTASAYNRSVSGAKVADLPGQMARVVELSPDPGYVTVLIGGNDLCTPTVADMTSVDAFRDSFTAAMTTIRDQSPGTYVYVVSIPDVWQLWNLFKGSFWARLVWASAGICQSLLANPTSTQPADEARREQVRQRNRDFNLVMEGICESDAFRPRCRFDDHAAFNYQFARNDVSGDYFHPSLAGQANLASVSWNAGYQWTSGNQAPTANFTFSCTDLACSFTNTSGDDTGVVSSSWSFGDGGSSGATHPSHSYAAAGSYPVTLTVTDAGGLTGSTSKTVSVSASPPPPTVTTMTIGSFSVTPQSTGKNTWTATGTTTVTSGGATVDGATVTVSWGSGSGTCVTAAGSCAVTTENLNQRKVTEITLTVTNLTHTSHDWDDAPKSQTVSRPA